MAFPEGTFNGLSNVVPATHDASPWPKSLVRLFKTYRTADVIYERMLRNLSPKLLSTVLSIFRPIDALMLESPPPAPPKEWPQSSSWQSSMRCGMQMVRLDKGGGVMTGVDVNPFWTDLAGLHKEEFISRAFNGDQNIPTSELRQMAKLIIYGMKEFAKIKIATFEGTEYTFNQEPVYSRFSRGWGRGDQSEGVLVRMSNKIKHDGSWMYVHNSLVMVSPEEFEAVRAHQPQLCESYLIPVVGSKSASELMNPRLLVEESFEYMNSCEEGRAQMDKLADVLADEFSFLYDFLARHKLAQPRANCTIAEQQL